MQKAESLLSELSFIPSTLFQSEVSYPDFLDRVHTSEVKLRAQGLWEVPHPWLNLLIPKSNITYFSQEVFGNILKDSNGPILIYPVNQSKYSINKFCQFLIQFPGSYFEPCLSLMLQVEQENIFCYPR